MRIDDVADLFEAQPHTILALSLSAPAISPPAEIQRRFTLDVTDVKASAAWAAPFCGVSLRASGSLRGFRAAVCVPAALPGGRAGRIRAGGGREVPAPGR